MNESQCTLYLRCNPYLCIEGVDLDRRGLELRCRLCLPGEFVCLTCRALRFGRRLDLCGELVGLGDRALDFTGCLYLRDERMYESERSLNFCRRLRLGGAAPRVRIYARADPSPAHQRRHLAMSVRCQIHPYIRCMF